MDYEAGKELDALVSRYVMQNPPCERHNTWNECWHQTLASYSTDIEAAMQVLERYPIVYIRRCTPCALAYRVTIYGETEYHRGEAATLPLAICIAALKAGAPQSSP